jgi:hypothetical protein
MKTYGRDAYLEADRLWRDFSDEWDPWRLLAAERGMLYPPSGTALDQWDDDEPSQRAMLIRAIRESPTLLGMAIGSSSSWGEVVAYVNGWRDRRTAELNHRWGPETNLTEGVDKPDDDAVDSTSRVVTDGHEGDER